ncbi:phosphoribosylanthranilate isomerase [Dentiradicibacter hellwigii]|uniref:N-(5'-phosphoribosyl)anthranilate isomerase n=1 Tax=Dentiradicibacter hellwigii TaxID=3149053 RepID=A0ABV4UDY5_9RHOO
MRLMTRIKICGLTRPQDVDAAVAAGADAIGLVFYPASPRYIDLARAIELIRHVPPFVDIVGLFVNAAPTQVRAVLAAIPVHLLQFHGDEDDAYCRQFGRPFLKAVRVCPDIDLPGQMAAFPSAQAILLDAFVEGYGGSGQAFDWTLVPRELPKPIVLSGGLDANNVGDAIRRVHPAAVDVSSGVESGKGIKDAEKMRAFVIAVHRADMQ